MFRRYLRIWAASIRYATVRAMMFRGDFLLWFFVEFLWMVVNIVLVEVIFNHVDSLAGWSKYEVMLLLGTTMLTGRLFTGFFLTNLYEIGRNVRTGQFDFFLAQPGNPLFMVSTRKLDLEGFPNALFGLGIVIFAAGRLDLSPSPVDVAAYALLVASGVIIHYAIMVTIVSLTFWIIKTEGIEGSYWALFEFSRIPMSAFRGFINVIFVYILPTVIVSNLPARILIDGFQWTFAIWFAAVAAAWLAFAVFIFHSGLRRYTSASS